MIANNFNLEAYCQRIGFNATLQRDKATLQALMQHQLSSVPFENLDVLAGKPISLVPEDIVAKLVHRQRGGYCYEVNGLFAMALSSLDIPYYLVAARPMFYPLRRPRTHMALIVQLDGYDWLVDLGFGSHGIRQPMRLDQLDTVVQQDLDRFKLSHAADGNLVLEALVQGEWVKQYGFTCQPQEWIDFVPANWLNSTHPDVIFKQKPLLVLFTPEGRKVLFGETLKTLQGDKVIEQTSITPANYAQTLRDVFGLSLTNI